jgi:hypothetical protein
MHIKFGTHIASFKETVEAAPPINIDEMVPFMPWNSLTLKS